MSARRLVAPLRPTLIAAAVFCSFAPFSAFSNPTGPTVVNGSATIVPAGPVLNITNTPNAIINWQAFSIGPGETTRFIQQSASSAVLNRVTTAGNVTFIQGALQSNGRVFLVNPSGIFVGGGAQIDVAGLVASSLNLTNEDFLAGRLRFTGVPGGNVEVNNNGVIRTVDGGHVYLIGNRVHNNNIIHSPKGEVVLAAGQSVELVDPATPNLRVEVVANSAHTGVNFGEIMAQAGRIGIYAGLVTNAGSFSANRAEVGERGEIRLVATRDINLAPGSLVATNDLPDGSGSPETTSGKVDIQAEGNVNMSGIVGVHGDLSVRAGGDISVIQTSNPRFGVTANTALLESGGNMVFNNLPQSPASRAGVDTGRLTLKATTPGTTIMQNENGFLRASERLDIAAAGDVSLPGINAVRQMKIKVDSGGDFLMHASPANTAIAQYEILGVDMRSGGSFSLRYDGFAFVRGDVITGPQNWESIGGALRIGSPTNSVMVSANGPFRSEGSLSVTGGNTFSDYSLLTATGPMRVRGEVVGVSGGNGFFTPGMLVGRDITIEAKNLVRIAKGQGVGSVGRIQSLAEPIKLLLFPEAVFSVNEVEGRVSQGQTGFFYGLRPARLGSTLLVGDAP